MHYYVVIVVISLFRHCIFKIYSFIRLSSRKCVINSVFNVQCQLSHSIVSSYVCMFLGFERNFRSSRILFYFVCLDVDRWNSICYNRWTLGVIRSPYV